jgi:hypothetical protein
MISGSRTLGTFEQALAEVRQKLEEVDSRTDELSTRQLALEQEDLNDYRQLAKLRVDLLATDKAQNSLDETERLAKAILEKRQEELATVEEQLAMAKETATSLALRREKQAAVIAALSDRIDEEEKKTQDRLDKDPRYVQQRDMAQSAQRTTLHADTKAKQSEEELESKGQPYRDDPLFMYLWQRGYLTPDYRAGFLTRWLDGLVGKLVKYGESRANFARLQEIPLRLREHAAALQERAEREYAMLHTLDQQAREADGITRLDEELEKEQEKLGTIDKEIEQVGEKVHLLEQNKADFAAGVDPSYHKAIELLTDELRKDDLVALHQNALATPFPEDDVIIVNLFRRREAKQDILQGRNELKELRAKHETRIRELERILADFKRNRFDSPETAFADGDMVAMMLGNFLNGLLSRDSLWKVLEQQRRYQRRRADPGFGSGGFGRGTVWGGGFRLPRTPGSSGRSFPFPGGGGGNFRFPSGGGGSSGGGFRTGGGF